MDKELREAFRAASQDPTIKNLAILGAAYLRSQKPSVKVVRILGRRWFSKHSASTTHTVQVYLDDQLLGESPETSGYDDHYIQTGMEIAFDSGEIPPPIKRKYGGQERPYEYSDRTGIEIDASVVDVPRKRDL